MELRPYQESDATVCGPWFTEDDTFMPRGWIGSVLRARRRFPDHHFLFVGSEAGDPVSIVSLSRDVAGNRAVVSLLVAPSRQRQGVGRATLDAVRNEFPDVDEIDAYVDRRNDHGQGLVQRLGLVRAPYDDEDKEVFVWLRNGAPLPADWAPPDVPQ